MHVNLILIAMVTAILAGCGTTRPKIAASDAEAVRDTRQDPELKRIAEEFVTSKNTVGVIMAIAQVDKPVKIAAAGLRKYKTAIPITIDDQMHLGSCTKAMTATLIARLIEKGSLRFESTLAEVLPDLTPHMHEGYSNVSLEQLLTHQSGMPPNPANWRNHAGEPVSSARFGIAKAALKNEPSFKPGTETLYSNLGYMIAGLMAERAGGATWEALMQREVFEPMGITSAGFGTPGLKGSILAPWGHQIDAAGKLTSSQLDNPPALGPAGTVHMTLQDWAIFAVAHASDGKSLSGQQQFLHAKTWQRLHKPLRDNAAMGWYVATRSWGDGSVYTHSGSNTYSFSTVWVAPAQGRAYLVSVNAVGNNTEQDVDSVFGDLIPIGNRL